MTCEAWRQELRRWLLASWSSEQEGEPFARVAAGAGAARLPRTLGAHVRECRRCAARLQAALVLREGTELQPQCPLGLDKRVIVRLSRGKPVRIMKPAAAWIRRAAIPVAAVLALALGLSLGLRSRDRAIQDTVTVQFVFEAPKAQEVSVVGDWNRWDPEAQRMRGPNGDGRWKIEIQVQRGREFRYQFLVDGERWLPDPEAPLKVEDGFGGFSSILQI